MMDDSEGRRIDFKNTLILLTSNVGSEEIMRLTDPRREEVHGVGVRFVSFEGSDRLRLEMFIDRNLPSRSGSAPA
jgi:ATP-dependent Clp protease ATP-binding subunit ClpA